jgi:hypothetical protein
MARRDGTLVRLLTRNGNDWSELIPAVAAAVSLLKVRSCLIDGEVRFARDEGLRSIAGCPSVARAVYLAAHRDLLKWVTGKSALALSRDLRVSYKCACCSTNSAKRWQRGGRNALGLIVST